MTATTIGPYRLDRLLGFGGMGEVHLAYDERRDRQVALKLLPEGLSRDTEYQQRFRRESHVAARLRDPHVIPIHDYGEIDGHLYIDMRLVEGRNIRQILDEDGPIDPARAVHLCVQAARALEAAHADGLVHRDIKPSNVLVTAHDFVYVVDFGIARSVGTGGTSLTLTGVTVGTLDYMAPERFAGRAVDARADVYSLACLLYECLTDRAPFTGDDLPSLMCAHLFTEPPRPSETVAGLPVEMDEVIRRGMAKELDDRFATPTELVDAARAALDGTPAPVRREPADRPAAAPPVRAADLTSPDAAGAPTAVVDTPVLDTPVADTPVTDTPVTDTPGTGPPPPPPGSPDRERPDRDAPDPGHRPPTRRTVLALGIVCALLLGAVVVVGFVAATRAGGGPAGTTAGATSAPARPDVAVAPGVAASIAVPTVRERVPVGPTPGYLEIAPNGRFAYIAHREAGVVTVLDLTINQVTATIPVPAGPPQFVAFSPDGARAYISIHDEPGTVHLVGVLDTATNTLLGTIPVGRRPFASATTPDGSRLYVPSHDDGRLDVIDTAAGVVVEQIPVAPNPHWVAFSADGTRLYTANHESNLVSVIDVATSTVLRTIPVGTSPHSTAVSPDGALVAVVNFDSDEVTVIDAATGAVLATVGVGSSPQDVAFAADGRYLYTTDVLADTVTVVDTATFRVSASIPAGDGPTSVAVTPDGSRGYVTDLNDGEVLVLDLTAA